jgi:uncharacterized membrane protein YwzB
MYLLLQKISLYLAVLGYILSVNVLNFFVQFVSYSEKIPKIKAVSLWKNEYP